MLTGALDGNLSIVCGSPLAAETTMKMSTTTVLSTTRLSSPSTAVLSMDPTSVNNITNANTINTTAAVLSEEGIYSHQIDSKCIYNCMSCFASALAKLRL